MKIYKIDRDNRDLFQKLDPFYLMTEAGIGDGEILGAFIKDSEGYDVPAGVIVYNIKKDRVSVVWLYVLPKYRNRNIGIRLLQKAILFAGKNKLKYVEASFCDFTTRKSICMGEDEFFKSQGFNIRFSAGSEWLSTVKRILSKPSLSGITPGGKVVSIASMSEKEQVRTILEIARNADLYDYNLSEGMKDKIDYETSFVMTDILDNITGAVLCFFDETFYPLCLYGESEADRKLLIAATLSAAAQKYGDDTAVKLRAYDEKTIEFYTKLMTDKGMDCYSLAALTQELAEYTKLDMSYMMQWDDIPEYVTRNSSDVTQMFNAGEDVTRTLEELSRIPALTDGGIADNVINIGQLSIRELFHVLSRCGECGHYGVFSVSPENVDYSLFDIEVSSAYRVNGEIKAIFIVSSPVNGVIYPLVLFADKAEDMKILIDLLKFSGRKAIESYPADTVVSIHCHDDASKKLCAKLVN